MTSMLENIKRKNSSDKIVAENNEISIVGKAVVPEYSAVGCTRLAYSQSLNSLLSLLLGNYESMTQVDKMVDMVETLVMILNNQAVVLLQQLWIEYQLTATLALRAKLSVQMLKLMVNIEGFAWNQVRHMQEKLKVMTENIICEEIIGEEEMHQILQSYSQRREERNRRMKKLGQNFSRMAKLVVEVSKGQGLATVPDIDGCLRDCKLAMGDLSREEWDKKLQPVLRGVLDRFQVVMDIVDMVWVELEMGERFCRLYDNVKNVRRHSVEEDSKQVHEYKERVERSTKIGSGGDDFDKLTTPSLKMKVDRDAVVLNREANAISTLTCSDNLGHAQVQKLSEPHHGSDKDTSIPEMAAENHTMLVEGFRSRLLCDMEVCPPLGSSTPRRRKSLPSNDHADDGATATEFEEDDLIKTKDFLVLMEQVTGQSATPKFKEMLMKLAGGSDHVRWSRVEKILDSEPDIVFE